VFRQENKNTRIKAEQKEIKSKFALMKKRNFSSIHQNNNKNGSWENITKKSVEQLVLSNKHTKTKQKKVVWGVLSNAVNGLERTRFTNFFKFDQSTGVSDIKYREILRKEKKRENCYVPT
jgi:hypothetical protein